MRNNHLLLVLCQDRLKEKDAARNIGVSRAFLAKSRMDGTLSGHTKAPPYIKAGRMIRYALADLDAWIEKHRVEVR